MGAAKHKDDSSLRNSHCQLCSHMISAEHTFFLSAALVSHVKVHISRVLIGY